jgi:hypothetical protein
MAISIPIVNTSSDTFQNWVDRTNTLIATFGNNAITANSQANGALTSGNGYVNGHFGVVTFTANAIHGGANIQSSANLNVISNLVISSGTLYVGANVIANTSSLFIGNSTSNAVLTQTQAFIGNSTINSVVNSSALFIATGATTGNALLTATSANFGNATVNAVCNTTGFYLSGVGMPTSNTRDAVAIDGTFVGTASRINFSGSGVANVTATVHAAGVGGSQINVVIDSTVYLAAGTGGTNTNMLFNDSGFIGGNTSMTWDKATNTFFVSNTISVGANVKLNTISATFGNSTVNAVVNSVSHTISNSTITSTVNTNGLVIGSNVTLTYANLTIGTTTANASTVSAANLVYSTALVGGNVSFTTTGYSLGNSTVNAVGNSVSFALSNSTVNTTLTTASFAIGANLTANTTALLVGNSTISFTANSVRMQMANSTVAAIVNSNGLAIGSNVTLTFDTLTVGNTVANATTISANNYSGTGISNTLNYWANTAGKVMTSDVLNNSGAYVGLTDAATINWDMATGINFSVTLAGNRTLANPTNVVVGRSGVLKVVEDATGSRTLSYGANYVFDSSVAPAISTTASKENYLFYHCVTASRILITLAAKGV